MMWLLALLALAADPDTEARARVLYDNGRQLYEEALYEEAILAFEEAYRLTERAPLLYNIASCYERLGRWREAIDTLNRYRAFAKAEDRETLERRIANLERRLAEAEAAGSGTEPASTDPSGETSSSGTSSSGTSSSSSGTSSTGTTGAADPNGTATVTLPDPLEPDARRELAPWILVGAGGLAGLGFGTIATVTRIQAQPYIEQHNEVAWNAHRPLNNLSFFAALAGGGLAATGLALALWPEPDGPVSVGPGGLRVRF